MVKRNIPASTDLVNHDRQGGLFTHIEWIGVCVYTEASSDGGLKNVSHENETINRDAPVDWGLSDFHSNGADGQGVDYNYVNIDWN